VNGWWLRLSRMYPFRFQAKWKRWPMETNLGLPLDLAPTGRSSLGIWATGRSWSATLMDADLFAWLGRPTRPTVMHSEQGRRGALPLNFFCDTGGPLDGGTTGKG